MTKGVLVVAQPYTTCMVVASLTPAERDKAVSAFAELGICQQLAEAAADLGWKTPSSIQVQAVPHLLQGNTLANIAVPTSSLLPPGSCYADTVLLCLQIEMLLVLPRQVLEKQALLRCQFSR